MTRTTIMAVAIVFLTWRAASSATPTAEDFTHCNEKAKSEMETASASPRTDTAAASTRPITPNAGSPVPAESGQVPPRTVTVEERDPQLQGIDAEGAKDPAYIAAYKRCMRQSGF